MASRGDSGRRADGWCRSPADRLFVHLDPRAYDKDGDDNLSPLESLDYYRAMSETFDATSKAAASLPPPTIPDGADLVSPVGS